MIRSFRRSEQKQKVFTLRNLSAQPRHASRGTRNLRNCRPDQGRFASRDNKPIRAYYDYNLARPHSALGHLTPSEFVQNRQANEAQKPTKSR